MSVDNMITLLEIVLILERRDLEHLQHMLNMEEQDHRDPPHTAQTKIVEVL